MPGLRNIAQSSGAVSVSTLTALKSFTALGQSYQSLVFALSNTDGTNPCTFIVETSEDGIYADSDGQQSVTVPAGTQGSFDVGLVTRRYWRISAQTSSPTYPTVAVTWSISGVDRF